MSARDERRAYKRAQKQEYNRLMTYFENIAAAYGIWGGLPKQCRSGWVERRLFNEGQLGIFKADYKRDMYDGFFILPLARGGAINVYGELIEYNLISPQKTFKRSIDDCVLIRANELRVPPRILIDPLVWELVDIRFAMRVNRNAACKTPPVFNVDQSEALTVANEYEEIVGNKPLIIRSRQMTDEVSYGMSDIRPPYYGRELREEYNNVLSEILTIMGILSNPVEKAERVNTVEATSNRGLIIDTIDSTLTYKKIACDEANEMFGAEMKKAGIGPLTYEINNSYTRDMIAQGLDGHGATDGEVQEDAD